MGRGKDIFFLGGRGVRLLSRSVWGGGKDFFRRGKFRKPREVAKDNMQHALFESESSD